MLLNYLIKHYVLWAFVIIMRRYLRNLARQQMRWIPVFTGMTQGWGTACVILHIQWRAAAAT